MSPINSAGKLVIWRPRRAIERLEPEILHAVRANRINQGFSVRSEGQTDREAGIRIEKRCLRLRSGVERHEIYFLHTWHSNPRAAIW